MSLIRLLSALAAASLLVVPAPLPDEWVQTGTSANERYGESVACAGDVNGDGFDDLIVGAPGHRSGLIVGGAAFVFHGGPGGYSATPDWTLKCSAFDAALGVSVSGAGDVNEDGVDDVIIGCPHASNLGSQQSEGTAFVFHGRAAGPGGLGGLSTAPPPSPDPWKLTYKPDWVVEGNGPFMQLGRHVARGGKVNGHATVLVSAPSSSSSPTSVEEGSAHAFYGSPNGLTVAPSAAGVSPAPDWSVRGRLSYGEFGSTLGGAGDLNGDGADDIIIGTIYHDLNGQSEDGWAFFVYYGSLPDPDAVPPIAGGLSRRANPLSTGPSIVPSWFVTGNDGSAGLGLTAAGAGDVNGDGFDDLVVGHPGAAGDTGEVYVFFGSAAGLPTTPNPGAIPSRRPDRTLAGSQAGSRFGTAVSTAGDVDGDGPDELLVGAPWFANGEVKEGALVLYSGGTNGPSATPAWTREGGVADGQLGSVAASAGDGNGNGHGDIAAGLPLLSVPGGTAGLPIPAGAARVFFDPGVPVPTPSGLLQVDPGHGVIPQGGSTTQPSFSVQATASDLHLHQVRLQVEVKPVGTPLDGSGIATGAWVDSGQVAEVVAAGGLFPGMSFHWAARTETDEGRYSAWAPFGQADPDEADIVMPANLAPLAPSAEVRVAATGALVAVGGRAINDGSLRFEATVEDPDGTPVSLEIELRPVGTSFTGTPTEVSGSVASGSTAAIETALPTGGYVLRTRTRDIWDATSAWSDHGGNDAGAADFTLLAVGSLNTSTRCTAAGSGAAWLPALALIGAASRRRRG